MDGAPRWLPLDGPHALPPLLSLLQAVAAKHNWDLTPKNWEGDKHVRWLRVDEIRRPLQGTRSNGALAVLFGPQELQLGLLTGSWHCFAAVFSGHCSPAPACAQTRKRSRL